MRTVVALGILAFALGTAPVRADGGGDQDDGHHCPHCKPETHDVCFNLVCHFDFDEDHDNGQDHGKERKRCTVASTFVKAVTENGGEVSDNSREDEKVKLEINCGDDDKFDPRSARRFTTLLGTRIQSEQGPDPALLLPRGALHTGPGEKNSGHYSPAVLELEKENKVKRAEGKCFIWTGFPFEAQ